MSSTRAIKPEDNQGGTFTQQLTVAEVTTAYVSPVPTEAPGFIVAEPGTAKEEAIYFKSKDAGAGTISGLTRDFTNLNGGVGQQHENGEDWEVLQSALYIQNIIDILLSGFIMEQATVAKVDADNFTVVGNVASIYNVGRLIRCNGSSSYVAAVTAVSYSSGTGLTTVTTSGITIPTLTSIEYTIQPLGTAFLTALSPSITTPKITTSINDANGNEVIKTPATASAVNEITVTNSATGDAVEVSATGGDTNIDLDITPKGTGVIKGKVTLELTVKAADTDMETGDAQAWFRVPKELAGMNLVAVAAAVYTAGTTGTADIQVRNHTDTADMLSTKITIDSAETDSSTAATPAVINTATDDVVEGDIIAIDVDAVHTTPAQGCKVQLTFAKP